MRYPPETPQEQDTVLLTTDKARRYYTKSGRPRDITRMPKKVEALFILLNDYGMPSGVPLNEHEIEINPITRDLPKHEKKLILEYWPRWNDWLRDVHEYKLQQQATVNAAVKADVATKKIKKKLKIDEMTLGNKLKAASQVFATETVDAAIRLAKTDAEQAFTDPTLKAIYDLRVKHAKDMLALARQLNELGSTYEKQEDSGEPKYTMTEEVADALAEAQAKLIERGIPVNVIGSEDDGE